MGIPVVIKASGGMPVTIATNGRGTPMLVAPNGYGLAVTQATNGLPVVGIAFGPTLQLTGNSVAENAAINTTVGTLSVTSGTTGTPTYTLTDSAGGKFNLSGSTLRTNAALDYETATSHNIAVSVSGLTPAVSNATFTVLVTDVVEASYTGPGDLVSGALGWWGLRAYNAAYATGSNPAIDITDQADAHPLTVNITSAGALDIAAINAWVSTWSVTSIKITRLYNQVSGSSLGHFPTVAGFPPRLVLNATGLGAGRPTMRFYQADPEYFAAFETAAGIAVNQPFSTSSVASIDEAAAFYIWAANPNNNMWLRYGGSNFQLSAGGGAISGSACAVVVFHAVQATLNDDGTGSIYTDGTNATGSGIGTTDFSAVMRLGGDASSVLHGRVCEFGIWPGILTAGNKSDLNGNQTTYWGPF